MISYFLSPYFLVRVSKDVFVEVMRDYVKRAFPLCRVSLDEGKA